MTFGNASFFVEKPHPRRKIYQKATDWDPPKTHSIFDTEVQETPKRLYISYFGTPPADLENRLRKFGQVEIMQKSRFPKRAPIFKKNASRAKSPNPTISDALALCRPSRPLRGLHARTGEAGHRAPTESTACKILFRANPHRKIRSANSFIDIYMYIYIYTY